MGTLRQPRAPRGPRSSPRSAGRPAASVCLWLALSLALGPAPSPALARDRVDPGLAERYGALVRRAEAAGAPQAAIEIYEEALLGFAAGYGRVHLQLGRLYQRLGRPAEAAANYRACMEDDRVDPLDREITCKASFEQSTVAFEFTGLPPGGRVLVLRPAAFAGAIASGVRLPPGPLEVTVEAPGRQPRSSELRLPRERPWQVMVGLSMRDGPLVPDDFLAGAGAPPAERSEGPGLDWRIWGGAGLGLAVAGAGVGLGLLSHSQLDEARASQRAGTCSGFCAEELDGARGLALTADGLWIGGAVLAAAAVVWWLVDP